MANKPGSTIQSMIGIVSLLMVSACTTVHTNETISAKTGDTPRITIEKRKLEAPPVLPQPAKPPPAGDQNKAALGAAPDTVRPPGTITARINPNEPFVNVRTAPSLKSRNIAVITGGQSVEILEVKDVWLKIKWQKGDTVKQGWLNKRSVEGYVQSP